MPADVTTPVTLTTITSAWGASVAADLAELWAAVAAAGGRTTRERAHRDCRAHIGRRPGCRYFTGSGSASLATLARAARDLLDDANAAAMRTTLGVGDASIRPRGSVELATNARDDLRVKLYLGDPPDGRGGSVPSGTPLDHQLVGDHLHVRGVRREQVRHPVQRWGDHRHPAGEDTTAGHRSAPEAEFPVARRRPAIVCRTRSGATVNSRSGWLKISARYGVVTAKKINTNDWIISGDLTT